MAYTYECSYNIYVYDVVHHTILYVHAFFPFFLSNKRIVFRVYGYCTVYFILCDKKENLFVVIVLNDFPSQILFLVNFFACIRCNRCCRNEYDKTTHSLSNVEEEDEKKTEYCKMYKPNVIIF